ncbi:DUF4348 domain-containing protein [uncultured Bacteroides sp.]|uniref:DUF4348 domain-containing protein n=1 Tax=uncultured Bacteroides sp. TaxID=162156 RepID=UPI002AAC3695|nr:DUF4348 domain-containing protein [uncultured Bacteroides sp.]
MRKIILGATTLLLLASCNGQKAKIDPFKSLTNLVDSANEATDSIESDSVQEVPKPIKADETFDDFIFSFASDIKLQQKRIHFPLTFINGKSVSKIEQEFWKKDNLFTKQSFYTMIFDKESDMDLMTTTHLKSAKFEWFYMTTNKIKAYNFKRENNGAWMLSSISISSINSNQNENFLEFFHKFASDSIFQRSRIHEPLTFVTTDPDDDFSILETTMEINQWFAFSPDLPTVRLSNINYGQSNSDESNTKIVAMKGLGNGFSNTLYFKRQKNQWEFYKFEDLSN